MSQILENPVLNLRYCERIWFFYLAIVPDTICFLKVLSYWKYFAPSLFLNFEFLWTPIKFWIELFFFNYFFKYLEKNITEQVIEWVSLILYGQLYYTKIFRFPLNNDYCILFLDLMKSKKYPKSHEDCIIYCNLFYLNFATS